MFMCVYGGHHIYKAKHICQTYLDILFIMMWMFLGLKRDKNDQFPIYLDFTLTYTLLY
jgi:hypothetical protein